MVSNKEVEKEARKQSSKCRNEASEAKCSTRERTKVMTTEEIVGPMSLSTAYTASVFVNE